MMEYFYVGDSIRSSEYGTAFVKMSPYARIKSLREIVYPSILPKMNKEDEIKRLYRHKKRVIVAIKTTNNYKLEKELEKLYNKYVKDLGLSHLEIKVYENEVEMEEEIRKIFEEEELKSREKARKKHGDVFTASARQRINLAKLYGESSPNYSFNKLNDALLTVYKISDTATKFEMYMEIQELKREILDRIKPPKIIIIRPYFDDIDTQIINFGSLKDMEKSLLNIENGKLDGMAALGELEKIAKNLFKMERSLSGEIYDRKLYEEIIGLELVIANLYHKIFFKI